MKRHFIYCESTYIGIRKVSAWDKSVQPEIIPCNLKHLTTKERIAAFNEIIEQNPLSEIDWGKPQGKEIW